MRLKSPAINSVKLGDNYRRVVVAINSIKLNKITEQ